jgi:triosephosphate isomerase
MRKKIAAGNWKMNLTLDKGYELASEIISMAEAELNGGVSLVLCTPYIHLPGVSKLIGGRKNIFTGAQNCSEKASGAYTGEVSAQMIASTGATFVVIGHSERRQFYNETDTIINEKVKIALQYGLRPILCCGETLEERENQDYEKLVCDQVAAAFSGLTAEDIAHIVLAYEPVWAIGTGKTASPQQAQDMHKVLRVKVAELYGEKTAQDLPILYGGSVKASNAKEIFAMPDVDGGLIGGASLQSREFIDIAKSF